MEVHKSWICKGHMKEAAFFLTFCSEGVNLVPFLPANMCLNEKGGKKY